MTEKSAKCENTAKGTDKKSTKMLMIHHQSTPTE